jgi:hypothetical protein
MLVNRVRSLLGAALLLLAFGVASVSSQTAFAHSRPHHRHHHGIPQHNGGDRDSDNNGGPSDGDGNI